MRWQALNPSNKRILVSCMLGCPLVWKKATLQKKALTSVQRKVSHLPDLRGFEVVNKRGTQGGDPFHVPKSAT
jgi:hypothetical protein